MVLGRRHFERPQSRSVVSYSVKRSAIHGVASLAAALQAQASLKIRAARARRRRPQSLLPRCALRESAYITRHVGGRPRRRASSTKTRASGIGPVMCHSRLDGKSSDCSSYELNPGSRLDGRQLSALKSGVAQSFIPTHSRQTVRSAAMITGPRKSPTNPNDFSPPRIPISTNRNGSRVLPPMSAG
jgi:hypothetical protein